ncbi:MAG: SDR family NAD(P)-dependent oxidoreductase [Pseudomonadota bacterium]
MADARPKLLLAGMSEGLGLALAQTFAENGFDVIGVARSLDVQAAASAAVGDAGGTYTHIACDLSDQDAVHEKLEGVVEDVSVAIFNAHALLIAPFAETDAEQFRHVWQTSCFGAYALAQAVLPSLEKRGDGVLIFTGATAGVRGGGKFAAFASAKFALRGLSQSLAREYGPRGVHVAHVILDGLIDEPQTTKRFGPPSSGARMSPDDIARSYLWLARQEPSAWTHELDLRPFDEQF